MYFCFKGSKVSFNPLITKEPEELMYCAGNKENKISRHKLQLIVQQL